MGKYPRLLTRPGDPLRLGDARAGLTAGVVPGYYSYYGRTACGIWVSELQVASSRCRRARGGGLLQMGQPKMMLFQ